MAKQSARSKSQPQSLSDQLREIIRQSPHSRYAICKAAGLDPGHMHKFVHGTGRLTNDTIDRLGEVLGLRLVQDSEE